MEGKPEYEARWEPDHAIAEAVLGDQETKVHGYIKCSAIGTQLISLGAARR